MRARCVHYAPVNSLLQNPIALSGCLSVCAGFRENTVIERFEAVKVAESPGVGMNNNSPKPGHGNYLGEPELLLRTLNRRIVLEKSYVLCAPHHTTHQTVLSCLDIGGFIYIMKENISLG